MWKSSAHEKSGCCDEFDWLFVCISLQLTFAPTELAILDRRFLSPFLHSMTMAAQNFPEDSVRWGKAAQC